MRPPRTPLPAALAALLAAPAPRAEASRVVVAELSAGVAGAEATGWGEALPGKSCFHTKLAHHHHYSSLEEAKAACEKVKEECGGLFNPKGDGKKFYLCQRGKAFAQAPGSKSSVQELLLDGDSQEQPVLPLPSDADSQRQTPSLPEPKSSSDGGGNQVLGSPEDLIEEWRDEHMGVAVSMVDREHWQTTKWGIVGHPIEYQKWAQSYVSIMTSKTDMKLYRRRSYGLVFHISEQYDFWKYFQVIGPGGKGGEGHIVGGPGDGGSHTSPHDRKSTMSMGVDYAWFTEEKQRILDLYNTVYKIQDYNEFIVNALPYQAIAGVLHHTRGSTVPPTDREMCNFLCWRGGIGSWPIYRYTAPANKKKHDTGATFEVERYLECVPDNSPPEEEYGCNKNI